MHSDGPPGRQTNSAKRKNTISNHNTKRAASAATTTKLKIASLVLEGVTTIRFTPSESITSILLDVKSNAIQKNKADKEAFLKGVDVEISLQDIEVLKNEYHVEKVERLPNKQKNGHSTTCKITFSDSKDRNIFVKYGLQIQRLHYKAEAAY
ncbi:unnamed protein product [Didymodactylos carnosus]|uniref:Uncharacterized protein n=1 Tax=Didymodactylos carnosus TaxID=1234261 RepID=A0A814D250_9BILA|nr:unnamed protein product [Didymodactylos carnosus]CAF1058547.1 unnamed protein product [Didymodactylos carnosus]CAF3724362.1 unnamed protein product [Didymodactylos carnosus]CAF3824378.1 unnamed protein product [Didymodactylos carnosus]